MNHFYTKKKSYYTIFVTVLCLMAFEPIKAQTSDSEIFGASPLSTDGVLMPTLTDRDWNVLPSEQGRNIDLWGREQNRNNNNNNDTTLLSNNSVESNDDLADPPDNPNDLNDDDDGPAPPPDDPIDVPLDGGTSILIVLAIAKGYQKKATKKLVKKVE